MKKKTVILWGALACIVVSAVVIVACGMVLERSDGPFYSDDGRYELIITGNEYLLTESKDDEVIRTSAGMARREGNVFNLTNLSSGKDFTIEVAGNKIVGGVLWDITGRAAIWDRSGVAYSGNDFNLVVGVSDEGVETEYTLTYEDRISTGSATLEGETWTLVHKDHPNTSFTIKISGFFIIEVTGIIYFDDGDDPLDADSLIYEEDPYDPEDGMWDYSCSGDENLNPYLADENIVKALPDIPSITTRKDSANWTKTYRQTTNPPGGKSKFTNAILNEELKWYWNLGEMAKPESARGPKTKTYRPGTYSGTVTGPKGPVPGNEVLRFIGVTQVSQEDRVWNHGTQFPMVGWMAAPKHIWVSDDIPTRPDEDTLRAMRAAKGYSFWIKVNSATGGNWVIKTAILTEDITALAPERGLEWKHYFGNRQPSASFAMSAGSTVSGVNLAKKANWTGGLSIGKWHQIKVYYDLNDTLCNIEQDSYIFQYNIERRLSFNRNKIEAFQWQIALQDQGPTAGLKERSGAPYDCTNGKYDFNVDFYGLELIE